MGPGSYMRATGSFPGAQKTTAAVSAASSAPSAAAGASCLTACATAFLAMFQQPQAPTGATAGQRVVLRNFTAFN